MGTLNERIHACMKIDLWAFGIWNMSEYLQSSLPPQPGFVLFICIKACPLALDLNLLIGKDAPEVASGLIIAASTTKASLIVIVVKFLQEDDWTLKLWNSPQKSQQNTEGA